MLARVRAQVGGQHPREVEHADARSGRSPAGNGSAGCRRCARLHQRQSGDGGGLWMLLPFGCVRTNAAAPLAAMIASSRSRRPLGHAAATALRSSARQHASAARR